jgi:hypothetical protein
MGLMIQNQQAEEDKFEFMKLQTELEGKRSQDKADRDFNLQKLEKTFDFHMKTKNVAGAREALRGMDEIGNTDLASRITDERMGEFSTKMKELDKADPSLHGDLMQGILKEFPVISHLAGGREGMGLTRTRREAAAATGPEGMAREQYLETGRAPAGLMGDKKGPDGGIGKKSKDAFAYVKTVLQTPNEFGTYMLDDKTARKATMMVDDLIDKYPDASPQRIGEMAINQAQELSTMAETAIKTGISKEPSRRVGGKLDRDTAQEFLRQAGGDKAKARQLANEAGYQF